MSKTSDVVDKMTQQQVFDFVVSHMKKQGRQSLDESQSTTDSKVCMYRFGELKCAAGCLIDDKDYDPSMEHSGWVAVSNRLGVQNHLFLINAMQGCHDKHSCISSMLEGFRALAKAFGLSDGVI